MLYKFKVKSVKYLLCGWYVCHIVEDMETGETLNVDLMDGEFEDKDPEELVGKVVGVEILFPSYGAEMAEGVEIVNEAEAKGEIVNEEKGANDDCND